MAFPLTLNHYALGTSVTRVTFTPVQRDVTMTRTWHSTKGSATPVKRTVSTTLCTTATTVQVRSHAASRKWAGIGGNRYLPTFPQLDKNATSFPHVI